MPPVLRKRVPIGSDPPATALARDHHEIARRCAGSILIS